MNYRPTLAHFVLPDIPIDIETKPSAKQKEPILQRFISSIAYKNICAKQNKQFNNYLCSRMKKLFSYLLLISFVFQSTSQLWIITNFYIQRDFIAKNLCVKKEIKKNDCQGQCHLKKQLHEEEKKQEQQLPDLKQKEVQLYITNSFEFGLKPTYHTHSEKIPATDENLILSEFIFSVFHPPRQA
jgi:hypothetical protein